MGIGHVSVSFSNKLSAAYVCDKQNVLNIEFLTELGDVPKLVPKVKRGDDMFINITVQEDTKGTKENLECAQNGICNRDIGQCACLTGMYSSSGEVETRADGIAGERGVVGERGDCGFRHTSTQYML